MRTNEVEMRTNEVEMRTNEVEMRMRSTVEESRQVFYKQLVEILFRFVCSHLNFVCSHLVSSRRHSFSSLRLRQRKQTFVLVGLQTSFCVSLTIVRFQTSFFQIAYFYPFTSWIFGVFWDHRCDILWSGRVFRLMQSQFCHPFRLSFFCQFGFVATQPQLPKNFLLSFQSMTEGQLRRENLFQSHNEPFSFVLIVFVYKYDTVRFSINESLFFSFFSEICNESKDQSLETTPTWARSQNLMT